MRSSFEWRSLVPLRGWWLSFELRRLLWCVQPVRRLSCYCFDEYCFWVDRIDRIDRTAGRARDVGRIFRFRSVFRDCLTNLICLYSLVVRWTLVCLARSVRSVGFCCWCVFARSVWRSVFAMIVARRSHFFSSFVLVCVLCVAYVECDGTHGTAIHSTTLDMVRRIKTRLNAPLKCWWTDCGRLERSTIMRDWNVILQCQNKTLEEHYISKSGLKSMVDRC